MAGKPVVRAGPPSAGRLLARLVDQPELAAAVRRLEPRALSRVIDRIGLEDAGEIVALATSEQLQGVFDDDLWHSLRPGQDEQFDAERFALWLEIMLEAGAARAADRLIELDDELVTLGLHRNLLVVDMERLTAEMALGGQESEITEKALDSSLHQEMDGYLVIARRHDHWDAILDLLLALDRSHHPYLQRLLERLEHASEGVIEEGGGLHAVLTAGDMLESDAAAAREDRRAADGYISPSQATAFLKLVAATDLDRLEDEPEDPITGAYFRELVRPRAAAAPAPATEQAPLDHLVTILQDEEVLAAPRAQLPSGAPETATGLLLQSALASLLELDPVRHARCVQELAYLANVLAAGPGRAGRPFRPAEAAEAALATCTRGLEQLILTRAASAGDATAVLAHLGPVKLFRAGWRARP